MPTLHVSEQGARITCRQGNLRVELKGQVVLKVGIARLDFLALYGGVAITTQALGACLSRGVTAALFGLRGHLKGVCVPLRPRNADLRLAQYARHHDREKRLKLARALVQSKLHNAACLLGDVAANHPEWGLLEERDRTVALAARAAAASDFDSLRGLEGAGTAAYFAALKRAFPVEAGFQKRRAHPSTDPANALLSFAYTLLAGEIAALVEARGLDSCLGFYHGVRSGFASLAYDLVELFRHPFCDRIVLSCFNLGIVKPDDFAMSEGEEDETGASCGLRLKPEALKVFLASYEKALLRGRPAMEGYSRQTIRELFRAEVEAYVSDLRGSAEYRPLLWRKRP